MFSSFFKKKEKADSDSKDKDSKGGDDDFEIEVGEEEKERPLYITEFIAKLTAQDDFSDVTFIVGKGKKQRVIPGHRIVLAAASPLFEAILYPPVFPDYEGKEHEEDLTVHIPDEDPDIFQSLLEGIYSDKVELNTSNLMPLVEIAKKYQIEKMQAFCADFMSNDITTDNACEIFQLGPDLLGDSDVALDFICENADEVFESKSFLNLSKERLAVLIRNDALGIDEGPLLQAVIKWGKHELKRKEIKETPEELKDVLKDLIPHIRFPSLDVTDLATTVSESGLLTEEQLLSLFQYIAIKDEKDRQRIPCAFNSKPRGGGFICKESKLLGRKFRRDLFGFFGKDVKKLELKLLYRGSKDGFTASAFHRMCDNKGATITVIKAEGSKNIFGGYTSGSWSSSGSYNSQPAWLFSLLNSTGKPLKFIPSGGSTNNAYCNSSMGPTWGSGHDLHINNNMKSNSNYSTPSSFRTTAPGYTGTFDKTLLAGASPFTVEDIEVFAVTQK